MSKGSGVAGVGKVLASILFSHAGHHSAANLENCLVGLCSLLSSCLVKVAYVQQLAGQLGMLLHHCELAGTIQMSAGPGLDYRNLLEGLTWNIECFERGSLCTHFPPSG